MLRDLISLTRPVQWVKNGVLLAPLVFAGVLSDQTRIEQALWATLIFCLLSSAVYTFNDMLDRKQDREHPLKKDRPIASRRVAPGSAVALAVGLTGVGLLGAWWLNWYFLMAGVAFIGLNLLYSIFLKNVVIIDAMSIAMSFVIRAYAGALAIDVVASKWLLINTMLLALFLAFGKRRHELVLLKDNASAHRKILGRYSEYLLDQCIGVTTASVVVMYMLYSFSTEVSEKLGTENLYLTIPFVVYGVFRYLYLIHKEDRGGSPTSVLISDRPILLTVCLWILTVLAALYWK